MVESFSTDETIGSNQGIDCDLDRKHVRHKETPGLILDECRESNERLV